MFDPFGDGKIGQAGNLGQTGISVGTGYPNELSVYPETTEEKYKITIAGLLNNFIVGQGNKPDISKIKEEAEKLADKIDQAKEAHLNFIMPEKSRNRTGEIRNRLDKISRQLRFIETSLTSTDQVSPATITDPIALLQHNENRNKLHEEQGRLTEEQKNLTKELSDLGYTSEKMLSIKHISSVYESGAVFCRTIALTDRDPVATIRKTLKPAGKPKGPENFEVIAKPQKKLEDFSKDIFFKKGLNVEKYASGEKYVNALTAYLRTCGRPEKVITEAKNIKEYLEARIADLSEKEKNPKYSAEAGRKLKICTAGYEFCGKIIADYGVIPKDEPTDRLYVEFKQGVENGEIHKTAENEWGKEIFNPQSQRLRYNYIYKLEYDKGSYRLSKYVYRDKNDTYMPYTEITSTDSAFEQYYTPPVVSKKAPPSAPPVPSKKRVSGKGERAPRPAPVKLELEAEPAPPAPAASLPPSALSERKMPPDTVKTVSEDAFWGGDSPVTVYREFGLNEQTGKYEGAGYYVYDGYNRVYGSYNPDRNEFTAYAGSDIAGEPGAYVYNEDPKNRARYLGNGFYSSDTDKKFTAKQEIGFRKQSSAWLDYLNKYINSKDKPNLVFQEYAAYFTAFSKGMFKIFYDKNDLCPLFKLSMEGNKLTVEKYDPIDGTRTDTFVYTAEKKEGKTFVTREHNAHRLCVLKPTVTISYEGKGQNIALVGEKDAYVAKASPREYVEPTIAAKKNFETKVIAAIAGPSIFKEKTPLEIRAGYGLLGQAIDKGISTIIDGDRLFTLKKEGNKILVEQFNLAAASEEPAKTIEYTVENSTDGKVCLTVKTSLIGMGKSEERKITYNA